MRAPFLITSILVAVATLLVACGDDPAQDVTTHGPNDVDAQAAHFTGTVVDEFVQSEVEAYRLVQVADGLTNPWGLAFLPDGTMLVTERSGQMSLVSNGELRAIDGLPEIREHRQGGLLDVKVHPDYESNGWIYFVYAAPGTDGVGTALSRGRLEGSTMTDVETLYSMEPKTDAGAHFGSRILFLGDGTLLFTIGDRGEPDRSQDTRDPAGSTIRLNEDGSIPSDNPFVSDDSVLDEIYTFGNRNSQGMAMHPETGAVWQTEHGPRGGDELNLIRPGLNYGWPTASWGVDYRTGEQIGVRHDEAGADITAPVKYWTPSIAPSGTMFYTGDAFPNWQGSLFIGSLSREQLLRVVLEGDAVVYEEALLENDIGRIRYVTQGSDGFIYVINDVSEAGIYRLEPAEAHSDHGEG